MVAATADSTSCANVFGAIGRPADGPFTGADALVRNAVIRHRPGSAIATSPFSIENSAFVKAASEFLKRTPEDVTIGVSDLEQAGVLLRRGRLLRITPDVLADHILHRACVTPGGQPTGFADRVFAAFVNVRPEKLFLNLAELDWRVCVSAKSSTLLVTIWKELEKLLCTGTPEKQGWVMGLVKEVAYYQPEQSLRMVELALKHLPPPLKQK